MAKKKRSKKYDHAKLEKMLDACIQKSEETTSKEKEMSKFKSVVKAAVEAIVEATDKISSKAKEKVNNNPATVLHVKAAVGGFMIGHGAVAAIIAVNLPSALLGVACVWLGLSVLQNAADSLIKLA
jgi:ElaB/YqjD/DUF883 family membrane-anchored ribosome-binding protein